MSTADHGVVLVDNTIPTTKIIAINTGGTSLPKPDLRGMKPECDCCCHKNIRNYTSPESLGMTLKCVECRCWD